MRAIPTQQAELLKKGRRANFSLFFSRMCLWHEDRGELQAKYQSGTRRRRGAAGGEVPLFDSSIVELGFQANETLPAAEFALKTIHTRQGRLLNTIAVEGGMVWEFQSRLLSPYVSGLGSGHPTETGMILDRNTGLPYIPASSLKGVLRLAHALDLAENHPETILQQSKDGQIEISDQEPTLRKYFGDTDTSAIECVRGQLVFLDAYPATVPTLRVDIMNPHFGGYYAGKRGHMQGPVETEDPIPVKFLTVKDGVAFIFRCFTSPLARPQHIEKNPVSRSFTKDDDQAIQAMFNRALVKLGIGGKTSVGYGRFEQPVVTSSEIFQNRAAEERLKKHQEEEARLYPWRKKCLPKIVASSDWGQLKQCMEDATINQYSSETEVAQALHDTAIKIREKFKKGWESVRDQKIIDWLAPAGISWLPLTEKKEHRTNLSPDEQAEINCILALKDWGNYIQAKISLVDLSLSALQQLKVKMKNEWSCDDKKAQKKNPLKKNAWDEVNSLIKKLASGN
ncbi:MAG: type III-B CRISPR module RAMP protein Cmr6 [Desulfocapsaceae bacterium]|nr:type III-B CRISPR module RAMP protein Cmr6 [Desulfocapsaceae bacterium]